MFHRLRLFQFVFATLVLLVLVVPAAAQFNAGIQGTVLDPKEAAVPGAKVTVTNDATGVNYETTSSESGFYRVAGLPPGTYTVTIEAQGFKKRVVKEVIVEAEKIRGLGVSLELGAIQETITVTAEPAGLQTETASVGGAVGRDELLRLPQVGRDPYELLRLAPGVFGDSARSGAGQAVPLPNNSGPGGSNSSVFQTENQVQVSANGQRISGNTYTIDGVSVNSLTWGGAALVTPNQESVKEVQVLSTSYSAEDGRTAGAHVKVVSVSGANDFHGSAIYKHGDPGLNAFNKYGGPGGALPIRVGNKIRQFGGSIGGPILKEKLFFFFSYEGLRVNNNDVSSPVFVETSQFRDTVRAQRSGGRTAQIFGQPGIEPRIAAVLSPTCAGFGAGQCQIVGQGMDIGSLTLGLGQYNPLGDADGGGLDGVPDIQRVQLLLPSRNHGNQFNTRIDYNRANDQFAYSLFVTKQNSRGGADEAGRSRAMNDVTFKPLNTSMTATWIRTLTPTLLNEARFNFTRFGADQVADGGGTNFGIPRLEVEGLPFDRIRFGPNWAETTPGIFAQNIFEFREAVSKVFRAHALKGGIELRWEQDNNNLGGGARPLYSFHRLWNLANDTPIFEQINADPRTGGPADAQRYFRTRYLGFFFQDDWKFRPNLTFNLGLRYEYFTPLREKRDRIANLIFTPPNLAAGVVRGVDELFEPDRNNFAPRLGFAWSPGFFENKMALRGGFGVAFNRIPQVVFGNTRGNPPEFARFGICCGTASTDFSSPFAGGVITYVLGASTSPTSYPANPGLAVGIDPVSGGVAGRSVEIYGSPSKNPNGYVYLWSLETEYRFPWRIFGSLGYQASSSHKLIRIVNQNFLYTVHPRFFATYFPTPDVNANFNAMNLRIRREFAQGFQVEGSYRWSKSIDTLSNEGPGAQTNQTNPAFLNTERGPSDFDATHYWTIAGLWDLPILRNRQDWVGKAFGGWQINAILSAHSGFPWTPVVGRISSVPITGADTIRPGRPSGFFGGVGNNHSTDTFTSNNGNFTGILFPSSTVNCGNSNPALRPGRPYFDACTQAVPGIGRNSFRGPRFFGLDFSFVKSTALPQGWIFGEGTRFDFRANFFNIFNKLNLAPFGFNSSSTNLEDSTFGMAARGLAGRVIEFQARFSF